ncbi:MAG: hypothetical protein DCC67_15145 [Planctomycetota bacterium]|nr:MAG: hypothetical protein DCC67_15145 [Planctomycetota bacterium]
MACFAFYALVIQSANQNGTLASLFSGDGAVLKAASALLFFTALARLGLRLSRQAAQFGDLHRWRTLASQAAGASEPGGLDREPPLPPAGVPHEYLHERLALLESAQRTGSVDGAGYMVAAAETDRRIRRQAFAGVRAVQFALPLVGLTGAACAVGPALALSSQQGWAAVGPAIAVAMQFIAQSSVMTLALLAARLLAEKVELRLIAAVDDAVRQRCLQPGVAPLAASDPAASVLMRQCERTLETVQTAVAQHDAALHKTLAGAGRRWEETASAAAALLHRTVGEAISAGLKEHAQSLNEGVAKFAGDLESVLIRHAQILSENIDAHTGGLAEALEHHTAVMTQTETNLAAENRRHLAEVEAAVGEAMVMAASRQEKLIKQSEDMLREMQDALVEASGMTVAQQQQLVRQSEILLKVVEATGEVRTLEEALNSNVAALAASHRFEETVVGLSAALQLLSANLGRPPGQREEITLHATRAASQAA